MLARGDHSPDSDRPRAAVRAWQHRVNAGRGRRRRAIRRCAPGTNRARIKCRFVTIAFLEEQTYQMCKMTRTLNNAPESGIGDDAYFSKDKSMPFPTLTVKKGGTYFEVTARWVTDRASVRGKGDDADQKDKDVDRAIARLILRKL